MCDLIKIKPAINLQIECLFCQSDTIEIREVVFQGMHILADCSCSKCRRAFNHTLPVGHDMLFPISFAKDGKVVKYDRDAAKWLAGPLLDVVLKFPAQKALIEKKVYFKRSEAIILNCLDSCYGHVLSKLWNAKLLVNAYPDKAIIVILPKNSEWQIPEGVAEVWSIKKPLSDLGFSLENLDAFVKNELKRFNEVYLNRAYIHIVSKTVCIEAYLRVKKFKLSAFSKSPIQITFILRDDRFWHSNSFEHFLFKLCVKFKILSHFRSFFIWRQNILVGKVAKMISGQLGAVKFFAVGIGERGGLSSLIEDLRDRKVTEATEKGWCTIYAKSQVVIGVHGSNMLIPTALSAGFIELLPRYKISHITEDLTPLQPSRYSLFLSRHLDHYATSKLISLHAVSMIRDFPFLYENTQKNIKAI